MLVNIFIVVIGVSLVVALIKKAYNISIILLILWIVISKWVIPILTA